MYLFFLSLLVGCALSTAPRLVSIEFIGMNKPEIWLYNDDGTGPGCVENTIFTFNKLLSNQYKVICVYAKDIINNLPTLSNESKPKLIIFPGGGDIPYQQKLHGTGCSNLRDYVMNGGNFLGLCAGGYFGCNEIYFKFGDKMWSSKRELSFNNDLKCCGPIIAPYDATSKDGARAALIKVPQMNNATFNVYYNGGGHFYFTNQQNKSDWNILATYCINDKDENKEFVGNHLLSECNMGVNEKELIAIIHGKFGKGHVILTGMHPEVDPVILSQNKDESISMIETLKEKTNNEKRLHLLQIMLSVFDINVHNTSKL